MTSFFYQKVLKYFSDFQNRNFSVLWLKWTQAIEMKQNQTFFHGTYSNLTLTSYLFLLKKLKYLNDFKKQNLLVLWSTVKPNNGNGPKSNICSCDIFKSNITFHWHKILKYFNDFFNWHVSISLQKWAQTSKRKWN